MQIAVLIYMMVQAVTFGIGIILVLATPLQAKAMELFPIVVVVSAIVSIPVSWLLAPRLQARYWRARGVQSDFISGPAAPSSAPYLEPVESSGFLRWGHFEGANSPAGPFPLRPQKLTVGDWALKLRLLRGMMIALRFRTYARNSWPPERQLGGAA